MTNEIYTSQCEIERFGGLSIETTENPRWARGWVFGDKTIKFEGVQNLGEVKERLGLELTVDYEADRVYVHVANPNTVSRMILSENDAVGSIIRGAKIKYRYGNRLGNIDDLVAARGQHITIEPFEKGDSIRICIYPLPLQ
jgi:hypothetical protein